MDGQRYNRNKLQVLLLLPQILQLWGVVKENPQTPPHHTQRHLTNRGQLVVLMLMPLGQGIVVHRQQQQQHQQQPQQHQQLEKQQLESLSQMYCQEQMSKQQQLAVLTQQQSQTRRQL